MLSFRTFGTVVAVCGLIACAPPEVSVPPPTDAGTAPSDGGGDSGGAAAPVGNDAPAAAEGASAASQGLVDGPGDRGGLGKEDFVVIQAEFLCADKQHAADEAARTQARAEIVAQHGTQQKWVDQVSKDITEEPDLEKQLKAKIAAKAEEICPAGGAPAAAPPTEPASDAPADEAGTEAEGSDSEAKQPDEAAPAAPAAE